jgi:Tol biopolymer transport system component
MSLTRFLTSVLVSGTLLLCIPTHTSAKIIFNSARDGGSLCVMDDDGSNAEILKVSPRPRSDGAPDWSPDGTRILFHRNVSKVGGQELELFVMDKDGNNVKQLTHYKVLSGTGTWGPDGRRIAFTSDKSGGFEIYVIDIETHAVTQLTHNPDDGEWAASPVWSPDGKYIAYRQATLPNRLTTIYVMRADGTKQVPLVPGDDWYRFTGGWSKDSESVLYFETRRIVDADGQIKLFESRAVIQRFGAKARQVLKTPPKWMIHSACFLKDDVLIAADRNTEPGAKADIYRYHITTGKLTNLTNHPADDIAPHWISDTIFSVTPLKKKAIQWGTLKKK